MTQLDEKLTPKWACNRCNNVHDTRHEALECCPPDISKVFLCPICNEAWYDEDDALDCCDCLAEEMPEAFYKFPATENPQEYIQQFCEINHITM